MISGFEYLPCAASLHICNCSPSVSRDRIFFLALFSTLVNIQLRMVHWPLLFLFALEFESSNVPPAECLAIRSGLNGEFSVMVSAAIGCENLATSDIQLFHFFTMFSLRFCYSVSFSEKNKKNLIGKINNFQSKNIQYISKFYLKLI